MSFHPSEARLLPVIPTERSAEGEAGTGLPGGRVANPKSEIRIDFDSTVWQRHRGEQH